VAARSGPRNTRLLVIGLVVVSLTIITVDYREGDSGPLAEMGRAARTFMAPLQEAVTNATRPVGNFFSGVAHLPSLAQENTDLRAQVADLQARIDATSQIELQNQELLDLLNLKRIYPTGIPAVVIAKSPSNFSYSMTIDVGSDAGIKENQPVVTGSQDGARLVGIVASVTTNSADVRLLIDQSFKRRGQARVLRGGGSRPGQRRSGPHDAGHPRDDEVPPIRDAGVRLHRELSRGRPARRFPPNILIGTVSKVYEGVQPDAQVSISPAVDFSSLETVLVLPTVDGSGS
jgi:rod shape-determining protein MreC